MTMNAKLSIKAENTKTKPPNGMIWSAGIHHVYVDNKPARVHVPQYTVLDTFNTLTSKLRSEGSVKFGVDHLPTEYFKDNKILAKMNLHDVGEIEKVVYDGEAIYIQESELTNSEIQRLHEAGELPAYSIVGVMEASPCPTERADYVVDKITIDRVDFVEEGGCVECKTGIEPGEILITSKKSKKNESNLEAESMTEEVKEEQVVESVEGEPVKEGEASIQEDVERELREEIDKLKAQIKPEEEPEEEEEVKEPEQPEEPKPEEEEEEESDEVAQLRQEIQDLKQQIVDGKKPVTAKHATEEIPELVEQLIQAGKATPAMKESLTLLATSNPEAFTTYTKQLDEVVDFSIKSKLAPPKDKPVNDPDDDDLTVEEAWKRLGRA